MRKKILVYSLAACILSMNVHSVSSLDISYNSNNFTVKDLDESDRCYGFIIPFEKEKEGQHITSIQFGISNLINDLLRLNISVYRVSSNFTANSSYISEELKSDYFFEKGAFIIPFTGDIKKDVLTSVIVYNYKTENEIESDYKVDSYLLFEPLEVEVYPLNYGKPAIFFGGYFEQMTAWWYYDTLFLGGFLDSELIYYKDIDKKLNNQDYNFIIWPGGHTPQPLTNYYKTSGSAKKSIPVRSFVEDGGGFIGSCYGANTASSGVIFSFNILQNRFKNIPAIAFYALMPAAVLRCTVGGYIKVRITNMSHPVCFGLNQIQESTHANGPSFRWKNFRGDTQALGTLEEIDIHSVHENAKKIPEKLLDSYISSLIGNPHWVTSRFGEGKIVVFADHPEMQIPTRNDRVIHNSVFYVTSDEKQNLLFDDFQNQSFIKSCDIQNNLDDMQKENSCLNETRTNIVNLIEQATEIDYVASQIFDSIVKLCESNRVSNDLFMYINNILQDSFETRMMDLSTDFEKLVKIYNTVSDFEEVEQLIQEKLNQLNLELLEVNCIFSDLVEYEDSFAEQLKNYKGGKLEEKRIFKTLDEYEAIFKRSYSQLLCIKTAALKINREIWYNFEKEQVLNNISHEVFSENEYASPDISIDFDLTNSACVIYVDDDAPPGGNGSIYHPFRNIQDAIETAEENATIYVFSGIYYEHLSINKPVKLIGENKHTTIIDGEKKQHYTIWIACPYNRISGFTIQNSAVFRFGGGILVSHSYNIIENNIFIDNFVAVGLFPKANNNTIENNYFTDNYYFAFGIDEVDSVDNVLKANVVENTRVYGCVLYNNYNVYVDNVFLNDSLTLFPTNKPLIPTIENNTVNGKPLVCLKDKTNLLIEDAGEVILSNCSNITIKNLDINNADAAVYVICSSDIAIENCMISNCNDGIVLFNSEDVHITNNTLWDNSWKSVGFYKSDKNFISKNEISKNYDGLIISSSNKNTVKNNYISKNQIGVYTELDSKQNIICENNFIENYQNAYDLGNNNWRNNYWDDWKGLYYSLIKWIPYNVRGKMLKNFDFKPAEKPYDVV